MKSLKKFRFRPKRFAERIQKLAKHLIRNVLRKYLLTIFAKRYILDV